MRPFSLYGIWGGIYILFCIIRTKILYHKARIIKIPFDVRGRKYMDFGENLTVGRNCRFEVYSHLLQGHGKILTFGKNVVINDNVHITALNSVTIKDNVLMASHIYISDSQHGFYKGEVQSSPDVIPMKREYYTAPVVIGENVWIGEHVSILPGVIIGKGAVVGANSVVTHEIPDYTIAVGTPAKVIKKYDFELKRWIKII